jgi:hypothetical protein
MRALVVLAGAIVVAGCHSKTDPCGSFHGTCVTLTLTSSQVARIDEVDLIASGAVSGPQTSATSAETFPIEVAIELPATASGALSLDVTGKLAGSVVGQGSGSTTVTPGQHSTLTIDLEPGSTPDDLSMGGDVDMQMPDLLGVVATARLLAPMSTATVTKQTPTLHWTLGPGAGTPVVDLCKDRACTQPQTATAQIAANGLSAVPSAALPHGWVFWRVRIVVGGTTMSTTPTWQFWVGKLAGAAVDSSSGTVLDVNGDGIADYLVGARGGNAAHVYLGNNMGTAMTRLDLTSPDGTNAFFGCSVSSVGDVNGDGFSDFLVGAYTAPGSGAAHLYLGSAAPSVVDWNGAGAAKRVDLTSPSASTAFGFDEAAAGDVNGDGYADFLVSAPFATGGGSVWLYLGEAQPSASDWNGTTAPKRLDFANPDGANALFGGAVASGGDINGDGFGDFLIGSTSAGSGAGAAHIYLGNAAPTVANWNTGNGTRIDLSGFDGANGQFGAVGGAGDVNGDGFSDFLIGTLGTAASATHVYLGSANAQAVFWTGTSTSRFDLTNPDAVNSNFGSSGAFCGDVNGDGYDDFVVGAIAAASSAGAAHLFLGEGTPNATHWNGATPTKRIDLASPDGANGNYGNSANGAGDVNGDGFADFIVGAASAGNNGAAHVYTGSATPGTAKIDLADPDGANALFGSSTGSSRTGS